MINRLDDRLRAIANREGSTRPLALIRIGLVLLLWNKFGKEVALFASESLGYFTIGLLFFIFSGLTLIGLRTKVATLGLFCTLFLIYHVYGLLLAHWEWTHHHVYVLMFGCFVLMLSPCDRSYSVDRWLALRKERDGGPAAPPERGPLWAQSLIPLQMGALYFWAAVDKTHLPYLRGDWLERIMEWSYAGHPIYPFVTWAPFLIGASVLVLVIEYYLAVAVICRLWPRITYPLGISLHICFALMLNVSTYSLTMILFYLALMNPDRVHRALDEMQGQRPLKVTP